MTTLHDLAAELEKLAAHFRTQESFSISGTPMLHLGSCHSRETFIALAKALPRPMRKRDGIGSTERFPEIAVEYVTEDIHVYASAERDVLCRLIEPARPAKYECEPLLSAEEEAQISA